MKTSFTLAVSLVALVSAAWLSPANADSAAADCQVSKDGDKWHGVSGPCTLSQHQGNIDLHFKNGETYSLVSTGKAEHFKDSRGNKVERTRAEGDTQVFKWEGGRKVVVTFTERAGNGYSRPPSYSAGETARDLADLVGAKAGQAEGELERRGYAYSRGSTSGRAKYSAWYNRSTGRCVMIRTEEGRYQSIVQAPPGDCGR